MSLNIETLVEYYQQNPIMCSQIDSQSLELIFRNPDSYNILKTQVFEGVDIIDMLYYSCSKNFVFNTMVDCYETSEETKKLIYLYEASESHSVEHLVSARNILRKYNGPKEVFITSVLFSKAYGILKMDLVKYLMCNQKFEIFTMEDVPVLTLQ